MTVIAVPVTDAGVSVLLPNDTLLVAIKPDPLIVRVKAPELATVDEGDRLVMIGTALVTEKLELAVPPPVPEFVTLTSTVPTV